jgi:protein-arginine kinase activator protein McsA
MDARNNRKKKKKGGATPAKKGAKRNIDMEAIPQQIQQLRKEMKAHAAALEFEEAAVCRDRARALERQLLELTGELVLG